MLHTFFLQKFWLKFRSKPSAHELGPTSEQFRFQLRSIIRCAHRDSITRPVCACRKHTWQYAPFRMFNRRKRFMIPLPQSHRRLRRLSMEWAGTCHLCKCAHSKERFAPPIAFALQSYGSCPCTSRQAGYAGCSLRPRRGIGHAAIATPSWK